MPQAAYPEVTLGHRAAGFPATSLFGLAPGGVCRAVRVATCAVRSYRTISPLPAPPLRAARRRYLSVALSVGSRPPGVTWHRVRRSPDFPLHLVRNTAIVWPTPGTTIPPHDLNHKRVVARLLKKTATRGGRVSDARPRARSPARRPRRDSPHSLSRRWMPLSRPTNVARTHAACAP